MSPMSSVPLPARSARAGLAVVPSATSGSKPASRSTIETGHPGRMAHALGCAVEPAHPAAVPDALSSFPLALSAYTRLFAGFSNVEPALSSAQLTAFAELMAHGGSL